MSEDQDDSQKTEQPTQKRLEEAFKKGNVPFSREIGSFFMLMLLALIIAWFTPGMLRNTLHMLEPFITDADSLATDEKGVGKLLSHLAMGGVTIIVAPLFGSVVAALAASFLQNGIVISSERIMPKLDKISPMKGFGRMFSMRSVLELLKGIAKMIIVGTVAFLAVYPEIPQIKRLPDSTVEAMLLFLAKLASDMTIGVAIAMFFIALADLLYQRFEHNKSLRMSKQEIKDEYKQSEGDPAIKQRLRRLRMERVRQRMMTAVPKSDVVITNPTHFAVALQYTPGTMSAPKVVAKGQDLIALRIRELADEHKVPIVENPPLARALFSSTDIDQEIPASHYEAVAKIISYVYQLKGKKFS